MLNEQEIINRLVLHEGLRLMPYKDSKGLLTIGIGRCIATNPFSSEELKVIGDWKRGITRNAAYFLCRNDIARCEKECNKSIPFFKDLDNERQYALIDMCFNLGISRLLRFKNMLSALNQCLYNKAARECLESKYAKDVGKRAERIANTIRTGKFIV